MKTNILKASVLGAVALVMAACADDIKPVLGTYSYKISGKATIDDTISVVLNDEMGALDILRKEDDKMLLTLNTMNGDVCVTSGKIDGKDITLDPFSHIVPVTYRATVPDTITVTKPDTIIIPGIIKNDTIYRPGKDSVIYVERLFNDSYDVTVSGTGEVYNETIVFDFTYTGNGVNNDESQLVAEGITMVAKKN